MLDARPAKDVKVDLPAPHTVNRGQSFLKLEDTVGGRRRSSGRQNSLKFKTVELLAGPQYCIMYHVT